MTITDLPIGHGSVRRSFRPSLQSGHTSLSIPRPARPVPGDADADRRARLDAVRERALRRRPGAAAVPETSEEARRRADENSDVIPLQFRSAAWQTD